MRIHALTVCVNYADWLSFSAKRWMKGLTSWTIVTDFKDRATVDLAKDTGANCFQTNVFYERGAIFNKGAALEAARQIVPWEDWFLLIDADVVPPENWFEHLQCEAGNLYGAWRHQCGDVRELDSRPWPKIMTDEIGVGYFQLFHTSDPHIAGKSPLIETCWKHAGVYDSHLLWNWPKENRKVLPFDLVHLGEKDNWFGRGNKKDFQAMNLERMRRGSYQHERIMES